jgi:hypothetical protein
MQEGEAMTDTQRTTAREALEALNELLINAALARTSDDGSSIESRSAIFRNIDAASASDRTLRRFLETAALQSQGATVEGGKVLHDGWATLMYGEREKTTLTRVYVASDRENAECMNYGNGVRVTEVLVIEKPEPANG